MIRLGFECSSSRQSPRQGKLKGGRGGIEYESINNKAKKNNTMKIVIMMTVIIAIVMIVEKNKKTEELTIEHCFHSFLINALIAFLNKIQVKPD